MHPILRILILKITERLSAFIGAISIIYWLLLTTVYLFIWNSLSSGRQLNSSWYQRWRRMLNSFNAYPSSTDSFSLRSWLESSGALEAGARSAPRLSSAVGTDQGSRRDFPRRFRSVSLDSPGFFGCVLSLQSRCVAGRYAHVSALCRAVHCLVTHCSRHDNIL